MDCQNVKASIAKIGTSSGFAGTGGLCLKLVLDVPMGDETSTLHQLITDKVHEARELFLVDQHHEANEEDDQRHAKLEVPTARLGTGTHALTLHELPPEARNGESEPLLVIKSAELGKRVRFEVVGQDQRMRLEVLARMAMIGSAIDCALLDSIYKSDVWFTLEAQQQELPGLEEGNGGGSVQSLFGDLADDLGARGPDASPEVLDSAAGVSRRTPAAPEELPDIKYSWKAVDADLLAEMTVEGRDEYLRSLDVVQLREQYHWLTQKATRSNDARRLRRMILDAIT